MGKSDHVIWRNLHFLSLNVSCRFSLERFWSGRVAAVASHHVFVQSISILQVIASHRPRHPSKRRCRLLLGSLFTSDLLVDLAWSLSCDLEPIARDEQLNKKAFRRQDSLSEMRLQHRVLVSFPIRSIDSVCIAGLPAQRALPKNPEGHRRSRPGVGRLEVNPCTDDSSHEKNSFESIQSRPNYRSYAGPVVQRNPELSRSSPIGIKFHAC